MDNDIRTWLFDVLQSIEEIDSYFEGKSMICVDYVADVKTKRAVERNLEIIGEAVKRITQKDENFEMPNVRQIIGARNRISHGYDAVSDDLIWSIVINHIPKLKEDIEMRLEQQ